uniref:Orct2_2 protein n=1 Tax=Fopius arisanus TaxID=64838 RepID=A0A0C9QMI4_9HYME
METLPLIPKTRPEVNGKNAVKEKGQNEHEEVDAVQEAMGALGKWQILICLAISLVKFPVAWHQLAIVFMAPLNQGYNCTSPLRTLTKDQCLVDLNGTRLPCDKWNFERTIFPETIISQWSLVCGRSHYANILQSILMFGILLGNITFGSLADRFGRKIPLMISVLLQLASGIGCAIVPWFPALLILKLLSAMATGGTMVTSYVICK